jgi:hypothetical protein
LALSLYIGPELIYIDVTPVGGKGKNMIFFGTTAPSIGREGTTCFFETQRHL